MMHWLRSAVSRLNLAVLALLLGWLAPLHAGGPSPSVADDRPTIQLPAVAPPPVVQVFLVAYRGQGPPEATSSESFIIAAMESQSGSTWRLFVVDDATSRQSAGGGFSGYEWMEGVGQYYLRARTYNPASGRFWTMDSWEGDGTNLYGYCHGMPVGHFDPSGHFTLAEITANLGTISNLTFRGIQVAMRVNNVIDALQYLKRMVEIANKLNQALSAGQGFGGAISGVLGDIIGGSGSASISSFMQPIQAMSAAIGQSWSSMSSAIAQKMPSMAAHAAARAPLVMPGLMASGKKVALVIDLPSPNFAWGGIPGIPIKTKWGEIELRSSHFEGRIFGIEVRSGPINVEGNYKTLLRVDYWNQGRLQAHYHVAGESAGGKHAPNQVIWP